GGRVPWAPAGVAAVLAGLVAGGFALGPMTAFAALWELVPTSGGTGEYDPRARGGVNDGDEETAGNNPAATGMVDTDQLLESPLPSLYDAISDTYGKPHKPREQERAQALSAVAKEQHGKTADSLRPSRTFPTSRQAPPNPRTPLSRAARGLFEIEGPTPLHIRAAVFDAFDGRIWVEAPPACPTPARREGKTNWMACPAPAAPDVFADEPVRHGVKVAKLGRGDKAGADGASATLDGTLIPAAPHLVRFKLGMIDQETFFSCGADGILRMALRKLPGGVALETESRVQDPRKLAAHPYFVGMAEDAPPTPQGDRIAALAREWAGHLPRGWDQIQAVVDRLRTGYELGAGGAPPDHPDAAAFFLFEGRRGPDYLFATSTAVLLRHLGYRTRLVAGFYAAPEMYDPETKHTPVGKEHVHVWPEVLVGGDTWVVVEPTPGYAVLTPPKPWFERAVAGLVAAGRWAADRPVLSGLVGLTVLAVVWWRRVWVDGLAVLSWRLRAGREWRNWVRGAAQLVERRARWAGRARPEGETPARYFSNGVVPADAPDRDALVRLAELTGWAAYAPDGLAPAEEKDVWAACDRAVRSWTYRRFLTARAARPRAGRV
ncbi:MAG: transglutaminase-like enzyme predicted cysteine protease, partial [Gemmataceae bacterium]|nr:transglutaminase-like enzyme predicted cysteine protease [Gemmataceae bacterium]